MKEEGANHSPSKLFHDPLDHTQQSSLPAPEKIERFWDQYRLY